MDMTSKHMISVRIVFPEGETYPILEELKSKLGNSGKVYERLDASDDDALKEFQIFTDEDPIDIKKILMPFLLSKGIDFQLGVY